MDGSIPIVIFQFIVLIFSAVVHEVAHGVMAERLGDDTAHRAGRITLNPLAHVSFFGMVLMPLLTYLAWGIPVGGAKPVPYNPHGLKDPRRGGGLIALAGPLSNLLIAGIFGIFIRISFASGIFAAPVVMLFGVIVYINIFLAIFNLVPLPPLDGSKVIFLVLPRAAGVFLESVAARISVAVRENWILFLVILFFTFQYVFAGIWWVIRPVMDAIFLLFTGASL